MKILVCISHVPDTTSKINFSENNTVFDKTGVQFVINPNDEFGLTRAIWFKEKNNAVVHVINVGLSDTESTLRKALAIGADKAIRINHNPKDGYSVAKYISNYILNNSYDLIIAGRESIDYNGGMVPGMISAFTDINFISQHPTSSTCEAGINKSLPTTQDGFNNETGKKSEKLGFFTCQS